MKPTNPYESSQVGVAEQEGDTVDSSPDFLEEARSIFLAWERSRIGFNVPWILLAIAALFSNGEVLPGRAFLWFVLGCGFVANLCLFAGPISELLMARLGIRTAGWLTFLVGVLAIAIAFAATAAAVLFLVPFEIAKW